MSEPRKPDEQQIIGDENFAFEGEYNFGAFYDPRILAEDPPDKASLYKDIDLDPVTESDMMELSPYLRDAIYEVVSGNTEADSFEYKTLAESESSWALRLKKIFAEYGVFIIAVVIILLLWLILQLTNSLNAATVAVLFAIVVTLGVLLLHWMWKEKENTRKEYEHAKNVFEPVKEKALRDMEKKKTKK